MAPEEFADNGLDLVFGRRKIATIINFEIAVELVEALLYWMIRIDSYVVGPSASTTDPLFRFHPDKYEARGAQRLIAVRPTIIVYDHSAR
jgi:hypothetical protein